MYFISIIYNLCMFWTSPSLSSGGRTVFYVALGTCVLYSWLSGMQDGMELHSILHTRQSAIQNTSAKCHIKYSSSSRRWTWRGSKHAEVINNTNEVPWEKIVHQDGFIYKTKPLKLEAGSQLQVYKWLLKFAEQGEEEESCVGQKGCWLFLQRAASYPFIVFFS